MRRANVLRGAPELAIGLHPDLIGAAKIVEVVHILPTEINLQRGKDVSRRQSYFLGFQPVDICVDRRRARVEQREYAGKGRILVGRGDKLACGLDQRIGAEPGTIFQH